MSVRPVEPIARIGIVAAAALLATTASATPYLLAQEGVDPLGLASVDTAHMVGASVLLACLVVKLRRVRRARAEVGRRLVSTSLGVALGGVYASGGILLVPVGASTHSALDEVHLMLTVWAAALALWHVAGHRRDVVRHKAALAAVAVVVAVPIVAGVAAPATVSRFSSLGADAHFHAVGPPVFLDALAADRPGGALLAGGSGLYVSALARAPSTSWNPSWRRVGAFGSRDVVFSVDVVHDAKGDTVLVGAASGLYEATDPWGPYRLVLRVPDVHAATVDGAGTWWCSSALGMWRSSDGGRSWSSEDQGMGDPASAWAVGGARGSVFASDADAVYRFTGGRWARSASLGAVVALDSLPGGRLAASSMGGGIHVWSGAWHDRSAGLVRHDHGGVRGVHVVGVSVIGHGRELAGLMRGGAAESDDGGRSWTQLWPQLGSGGVVWRILYVEGRLVAATDSGLQMALPPARRPAPPWWWASIFVAGALTAVVAALATRTAPSSRSRLAGAR